MKEFTIKKKFNGYEAELSGEWDCGDFVTSCYVTYRDASWGKGCDKVYASSLAVLEDFGTLEGDSGEWKVAPTMINLIANWAEENGY